MEKQKWILAIDIGGTRIRMGLVSEENILQKEKSEFVEENDSNNFIPHLCERIKSYLKQLPGDTWPIAVAVGVPSTLSKDRKLVISTPNIQGLNNVRLQDILEKELNLPVFVERDVNYLLCYDVINFRISSESTVIACYMGTGIGNAVQINGELLTGHSGVACELGHIPVFGNDLPCVCGNTGCIETIASGKYLLKLCEQNFGDQDIKNVFVNYGDTSEIHTFIEAMSIPVATEINIFAPEYVIIGGGVPAMEGFPRKEFEDRVLNHVRRPLPAEDFHMLYSEDGDFSGVRGGGLYVFDKLKRAKTENL